MPDTLTDAEIAKKLAKKAIDKTYREANKEKLKAWNKANPENRKKIDKKYMEANRDRLNARSKIWNEANHNKHIQYRHLRSQDVTDGYVKGLLCKETHLKPVSIPQELIELKREQILLMRALKEFNHELNQYQERTTQP